MADYDLKALSAPVEALREDVLAAYSELDKRWSDVADTLGKLPIPCDVSTTISWDERFNSYDCLEWRKWGGKKRFCYTHYADPSEERFDVVPYEEWSGTQRCDFLKHIPKLFERAAEQTKQFIEEAYGKEASK